MFNRKLKKRVTELETLVSHLDTIIAEIQVDTHLQQLASRVGSLELNTKQDACDHIPEMAKLSSSFADMVLEGYAKCTKCGKTLATGDEARELVADWHLKEAVRLTEKED